MQTGVKDARKNLPQLLKQVGEGEQITLTCRGKKVARIVPYAESHGGRLVSRAALRAAIRAEGGPLSACISEDREERR